MKYKADCTPFCPAVGAVIVCAGKGERTGLSYNKVLYTIGVKTVLETALDVFTGVVDKITVVAAESDMDKIRALVSDYPNVTVALGGKSRTESVLNGLAATPCDIVVVHDGARPFVTEDIIKRSVESAISSGSGIAAVPCVDTVKHVENGIVSALPRKKLFAAQTPQTFRYDEIFKAYNSAIASELSFTDDAEVYEHAGFSPTLIEGSYANKKITTSADLFSLGDGYRIGVGYDVHRLVYDRPLILGGVHIPFEKGLLGHSDADALTHAIMDALLSAAGLPDIGVLFPDTDERFLGADSVALLKEVVLRIKDAGYKVNNISAVAIAQRPKLAPFIGEMKSRIAEAVGITADLVNISATTTEGLGVVGKSEAIAANASCILTGNGK